MCRVDFHSLHHTLRIHPNIYVAHFAIAFLSTNLQSWHGENGQVFSQGFSIDDYIRNVRWPCLKFPIKSALAGMDFVHILQS